MFFSTFGIKGQIHVHYFRKCTSSGKIPAAIQNGLFILTSLFVGMSVHILFTNRNTFIIYPGLIGYVLNNVM